MNNSLITWRVLTMTLRGKVEQRHSLKGWCLKLPPNVSVALSFRFFQGYGDCCCYVLFFLFRRPRF